MRAAREDALRRVTADLPVAARLYSVPQGIESAPAIELLRELMPCVLAADCWSASLACPQEEIAGAAWGHYFVARLEALQPVLSAALARSIVLERVPIQWIPHEQVIAELTVAMAKAGFHTEVTAMQLVPPVPGGHDWVRRDCGQAVNELVERAKKVPVAAILHWPNRTVAALVATVAGRLKAYGVAFGPDGVDFDVAALSGATVVATTKPAVSIWWRFACALGLHWLIWRWTRRQRLRHGGNPLAAI